MVLVSAQVVPTVSTWPQGVPVATIAVAVLLLVDVSGEGCWDECARSGFYCEEFCCQPPDGLGNPTCWDAAGHYTYETCCGPSGPPEPLEPPVLALGSVALKLYRGPSDHNSPRFNERTVEVALGLWFMRRSLQSLYEEGGGFVPLEVGNVLSSYWPSEELVMRRYVPWTVADLVDNGVDATSISFEKLAVLSLSTVEHIGYDNEGSRHLDGFRLDNSPGSFEAWAASWAEAPRLLARIAREASAFLVTFPIGVNPRLDAVVASEPGLRRLARVARRVDAANRWELDPNASFAYHYDFRDTYSAGHVGQMFDPELAAAYRRVFGQDMPPRLPLPLHPRFRFANAICIVTNVPELLA